MSKYVLFLCVLFISCKSNVKSQSQPPAKKQRPQYISPVRQMEVSEIDGYNGAMTTYMNSKLNNRGFSGGILIVKNDQVLYEHYQGFVDAAHKIPISDTTPFHVASTSKTFTSHAIFQLIEDGKISLLDTINKFFPGFPYQGMTIKNLLSHTTGLANYANFMDLNNWDKKQVATNNDMLQIIIRDKPKLEFPTGSHFSYCNTNFALLALIVEKVTGIPFPRYVKENIFDKVGMKHSYIMSVNTMDRYTPSFRGSTPFGFEFVDAIYGDKNVYTTCTDLKRYDSAIRNRVLLDSISYDQMWQPLNPDRHSHNSYEYYGLGWRLKVWPNGNKIVYHNGWWHGNNSLFQRLIMDTAVMIITGNKFDTNIYSAAHAANIFRAYYDVKAGDEGEFDPNGQAANATDQQEPKQERPSRRSRHARVVKSTKQTKAVKHTKTVIHKKKKAKK